MPPTSTRATKSLLPLAAGNIVGESEALGQDLFLIEAAYFVVLVVGKHGAFAVEGLGEARHAPRVVAGVGIFYFQIGLVGGSSINGALLQDLAHKIIDHIALVEPPKAVFADGLNDAVFVVVIQHTLQPLARVEPPHATARGKSPRVGVARRLVLLKTVVGIVYPVIIVIKILGLYVVFG